MSAAEKLLRSLEAKFASAGVRLLTANGDDLADSSDPSRKMMRQIAGSFAEYEKARLVSKLKAARERKRAARDGRRLWSRLHAES